MIGVLQGFSVIAVVIGVGYVIGRRGVLGPRPQSVISRLVFWVATPALLFTTLSKADLHEVFSTALLTTVVSSLGVALAYAAVSLLWWRRPVGESTVGALASCYVNAGNLGIPIAVYVLGNASFVAPVMLFQLVVLAPTAFAILDVVTGGGRIGWRQILLRPLRNPITIASLVGLFLSAMGWSVPDMLARPIALIGNMMVPGALLAFGISLHGAPRLGSGGMRRQLSLAIVLKNLAQPVVAFCFAYFALGMTHHALLAATVTAALPSAQNVFVYATRYDTAVDLARDSSVLTTLIAVPVVVVIAALIA